jgi:hypothetical protein
MNYNLICIFICTPICTKKFILATSGCYKSEETGNWCVESVIAESEILVLQLAFSAAHSADMGGN